MSEHWQSVARHTPLAILADLDGTLIPFAPTPEQASPDPELLELLRSLTLLQGVQVVVVSGRTHAALERFFPDPALWLVAEHGAWCRGQGAWQPSIDADPNPIAELADRLETIAKGHAGASVERKSWSCAVHYRQMRPHDRAAFGVEITVAIEEFLKRHPSFERIDGDHVIEIRAAAARKSFAVEWVKSHIGGDARLVAIGDDLTDEHLFAALDEVDEPVLVRGGIPRHSHARWAVADVDAARQLLTFIRDTRIGVPATLPVEPIRPRTPSLPSSDALLVLGGILLGRALGVPFP